MLCLQNGVDNTGRLRIVLPQHAVAAAVVNVATEMAPALATSGTMVGAIW